MGELAASSGDVSLEKRFKDLDKDNAVDDMLANLKRQLPGAQRQPVAELPPAKVSMSALDEEYERLKKELRK